MSPVDLAVEMAGIEKQHRVLPLGSHFAAIEEPQGASQGHRIEHVRTHRHYHIHRLRLDQLLADRLL